MGHVHDHDTGKEYVSIADMEAGLQFHPFPGRNIAAIDNQIIRVNRSTSRRKVRIKIPRGQRQSFRVPEFAPSLDPRVTNHERVRARREARRH